MTLINKQQVTAAGLLPVFTAVTASDTFAPDTGQFLYVKNASGGAVTVTVVDAGTTPAGNASANLIVSVPAASERAIYIAPSTASTATGLVTVNYSATASITAALIRNVS